jgi:hypothetical protein
MPWAIIYILFFSDFFFLHLRENLSDAAKKKVGRKQPA